MFTVVSEGCPDHEGARADAPSLIDEIVREGARRMLAEALRGGVDAYIAAAVAGRDENGRRLVVGHGYHQPREVFPQAKEGRCWFRKTGNVLAALPRSAHPGAKKALAGIWGAGDKNHAQAAVKAFGATCGTKFPRAAAKITDDAGELLAFYDYPAGHWVHLRTTNPIEPAFATVRHRTKVTNGPGSPAAGLAMAFKLIESAQARWRAVNAPRLVALVRAGALFGRGVLVERPEAAAA